MIVLPNTPPRPISFVGPTLEIDDASLHTLRASIQSLNSQNSDSIRYVLDLEQYLDSLYSKLKENLDLHTVICTNIPWSNLIRVKPKLLKSVAKISTTNRADLLKWTLLNEVVVTAVSVGLLYVRIASDLLNNTINIDVLSTTQKIEEVNENWKRIVNLYKKSISFFLFAEKLQAKVFNYDTNVFVNKAIAPFLIKVSEMCIQVSILAKSLWLNRSAFERNENFGTENNTTLSKVAISCVNELESCLNLLNAFSNDKATPRRAISDNNDNTYSNNNNNNNNNNNKNDNENNEVNVPVVVNLNYDGWYEYLTLFKRYVNAYAALFLAIQSYKEGKIGNALGLIHFGLLSLQSKKDVTSNSLESNIKSRKPFQKLREKTAKRKNEKLLLTLDSISTLKIKDSSFNDKSGIVLNDLAFLFDQLIKYNNKFTLENNKLNYEEVVHWTAVGTDTKWPIGCKIPISNINPYEPGETTNTIKESDYAGRGSYF
ncbi:hypothetical protein LELG_04415 [Lodderomyces elongisporus NRRL YB-4239]|uniref:Uncharacterized protein n=1 Tax=Lodderomyces elongisporus (strain ATCC 11503 / CBS 2605 / JCM 1781 / NBRC 1676 / NRRL YB-4239) TaxID=379508 RepID=A5E476_LODEL|nr:hypothetical protein LELG_04415 [Lodderomyces elongisporus NRRL YB-4239]